METLHLFEYHHQQQVIAKAIINPINCFLLDSNCSESFFDYFVTRVFLFNLEVHLVVIYVAHPFS